MKKILFFIAVLLFISNNVLIAQNRRVTGTVTESGSNAPMPYVTVQLKGSTTGTHTLENGSYDISAPANGILIFSFIGFKTVEVPVNNRSVVNVQLNPEAVNLTEVVAIAYGTAKRESVTGSISSMNTKSIERRALSSVASALEGQAAGVQVNSTYGEPGSDPIIRIRGFTSVNGSNAPLYVIDGVPFGGNISDINPADIENMSILKDAASGALYGNRASNGVVMLTTKRGTSEKVSIRASINQGVYTRGLKEYDRVGPDDFMEIMWKGYRNSLMTSQAAQYPTQELANAQATSTLISTYLRYNIYNLPSDALFDSNGKLLPTAKVKPQYTDLDWFKEIERLGYRQDYVVSGDGASEKHNYFFSVGYLDEKGYIETSDFKRITARTNISLTPKKWLRIGLNLSGSHQIKNTTLGSPEDNPNSYANPFMYARQIAPIYPVYLHNMDTGEFILDENGNRQYDEGGLHTRPQYAGRHVIWEYELDMDRTFRKTLAGQTFAEIKFLKGFTFTVRGDLNLRVNDRRRYNSPVIGDGMGTGRAFRTNQTYTNYTFQKILNWNRDFDKHNIDFMAAHENFSYNYVYQYGYKTNMTFKGDNKELINFTVIGDLYGYQRDYRTESYLSRIRYNYDNKYFFDASIRRDGTSKFSPENRWGNFWSVGGSWTISKEDFMAPFADKINSLKLRASYGEVGNDAGTDNDAIDFHAFMPLYSMDQNGNRGAIYKTQNEARDLVWEAASSFGVGLEGRVFDRLNFALEYFDKRSKDLLFDVYLPLSAGATSNDRAEATVKKNLGSVANKGMELTFDVDIIQKPNFRWNFGVLATHFKNKIISLPPQNRTNGIVSGTKKFMEGHDRYAFWLYQFVGIDQMTGNSLFLPDMDRYYIGEAVTGKLQLPSQWIVNINDVNYVTNSSYAKKDWFGSAIPDLFGSITTSLTYKNLDLSVLCTYSLGGKTLDNPYINYMSVSSNPSALHKDLLNSWDGVPAGITETSPNRIDPNGLPVINYSLNTYNSATSSRFLLDASYFVVKNISLGYAFPKRLVKKLDLSSASFKFSIENLATFTKLRGMDPQQSFTGVSSNGFVTARVFSVGINVNL